MSRLTLGLAICGSFCTHKALLDLLPKLCERYRVIPIFSEAVQTTSTRFGSCREFCEKVEAITSEKGVYSILEAERIGPEKRFDILAIAPCTGNTLSKLAHGIIDATVPMAAKAHLRNARPLVIALASNDALAQGLANIASLIVRKGYYFVPFGQDDPVKKPTSLVCDLTKLPETIEEALKGSQIQPILRSP